MRLFIALPLDEEAKRGVAKVIKKLQRGYWPVAWVAEDKWHVTAAFCGEIQEEKVEEVVKVVEAGVKEIRPFTLGFKGLGAFPDLLLPRVIWLGLNGDLKSLYQLVKQIRTGLKKAGINFDEKTVRAHVTLGRIKETSSRKQRLELGKIITKNRVLDIPQKWLVEKVMVYDTIKSSYVIKGGSQLSFVSNFGNYG